MLGSAGEDRGLSSWDVRERANSQTAPRTSNSIVEWRMVRREEKKANALPRGDPKKKGRLEYKEKCSQVDEKEWSTPMPANHTQSINKKEERWSRGRTEEKGDSKNAGHL